MYTEPFYSHLIYPCFDQPNLKSEIEILIYAHKDMHFVSNSKLTYYQLQL
jgi:aminopeptidase N